MPALSRLDALLVVLVVMAAMVLRLPGLDEPRWLDELANLALAREPIGRLLVVDFDLLRPPLWELLLALWVRLFGESTARWLPLILGSLQIGVVYVIGRHFLSRALSVGVAMAVAVCPAMLWVAGDIRPDALLGLTVTLSWATALWGLNREGSHHQLLHLLATLAALYTHPWAVLGIAPQVLFWRRPRHWLEIAILATPSLLWIRNISESVGPTLQSPHPSALFWYLHAFAFSEHLSFALVSGAVAAAVVRWMPNVGVLLAWLLGPLLVGMVISVAGMPILDQRYAVIAMPALWLLVGIGLGALSDAPKRLVVGLLVLLGSLSMIHHRFIDPPPRADWDALAATFTDELRDEDILIAQYQVPWGLLLDRIPEPMTEAAVALQRPSGQRVLWLMGEHPEQHTARVAELKTHSHLLRRYEAPGGAAVMMVPGGRPADFSAAIGDPPRVPLYDHASLFLYAGGRVLLPDLVVTEPGRYAVDVIARGPVVGGVPTLLTIGLAGESEPLEASPDGRLVRAEFDVDVPGEVVFVRFLNDEVGLDPGGVEVDRNLWIQTVVLSRVE